MTTPRSYHDRGQLFGTDGQVTWQEPELSNWQDIDDRIQRELECQVCGAPAGEPHGESQQPEPPYAWEVVCEDLARLGHNA